MIASIFQFVPLLLLLVWPPPTALQGAIHLQPPTGSVPPAFIGINLQRRTYTEPLPPAEVHAWRSFDAAWYKVEPVRGDWHFDHSDATVADAQRLGVDLDLVLTSSPTWASARPTESVIRPYFPKGMRAEAANLDDWTRYVHTVAERYKGRVHTYELWNEPNLKDWYSGDADHMAALCLAAYRTLKAVDPSITVISPGFSPYSHPEFVQAVLQHQPRFFDVLGYHFYTERSTPERQVLLLRALDDICRAARLPETLPVWDMESGYLVRSSAGAKHSNASILPAYAYALDDSESEDFLVRAYVLGWALHIERYYWFSWGSDIYAVVDDAGDTEKPVTRALRKLSSRLVGSTMLSCDRSTEGLWTVNLRDPHGHPFTIIWSDASTQAISFSRKWKTARTIDDSSVPHGDHIEITGTPIFLS